MKDIDPNELHPFLVAYSDASREYGEAKRVYQEKIADLDRQRKEARVTLNEAFDRYKAAGNALSRFTGEDDEDAEAEE